MANGIIPRLEKEIGHSLHWFVCQLHANELPLRHLFKHLDGDTTGPSAFAGVIGKSLMHCEKLPIGLFQPINTNDLPAKIPDLSSDQAYLLEICHAVSTGIYKPDLVYRSPGKMAHSRWVTTANRILRLYISIEKPSKNLKTLATYIVRVYGPMWFLIKKNCKVTKGANNWCKIITLSRYLPKKLKAIIDAVIQRNAYFAHTENLLIAMLADKRPEIRKLAVCRILEARSRNNSQNVRVFKIPKLNFKAKDYIDLIDWRNTPIYEPPMVKNMSKGVLIQFHCNHLDYPCHTQSVERCVKMVTEAAGSVAGPISRDGQIRAKIASRQVLPKFDSKKDYVMSTSSA